MNGAVRAPESLIASSGILSPVEITFLSPDIPTNLPFPCPSPSIHWFTMKPMKRLTSDRRTAASRANGSKSCGPVTARGKYNSAQNPIRHGILSRFLVLPGESPELFEDQYNEFMEEHQPRTQTERALVEDMVTSWWRKQRIWGLESVRTQYQIKMSKGMGRSVPIDDAATRLAIAYTELAEKGPSLDLFIRYETRYERQFHRALARLLDLKSRDPEPDQNAPAVEPSAESVPVVTDPALVERTPGVTRKEPAPDSPARPVDATASPASEPAATLANTVFATTSPEVVESKHPIFPAPSREAANPPCSQPSACLSTPPAPPQLHQEVSKMAA